MASALSFANVITEYPITVLCISIERKKKKPSGFDNCLPAKIVLAKTADLKEPKTKSN